MDDYQMIQQRGVQELVAVSRDEEDLPCIYLSAIDRIFPNANVVSSYGVRIPFSTNRSGVPVLDVECDNSQLEWSREATAARIAAVAAAAAHLIPPNTVHTAPVVSITDLDLDLYSYSDDDNDISHNTRIPAQSRSPDLDSDDNFDMIESEHSSDEDSENAEDEDGDDDDNDEMLSRPSRSARFAPPPQRTITTSSTSSTTGQLVGTAQSFERLRVGLQPIPETNPFVRDLPPSFNTVVSPLIQTTVTLPPSVVATPTVTFLPAARHAIPEESLTNGDAAPPPIYEPIDTLAHDIAGPGHVTNHATGASESHFVPPHTIDDPSERHLVHDRVEIIKKISQTILNQKYESEVCPHPPLFVLLPENPLRWSFDNLLHNKMRLYFLCDCCEHDGFVPRGNSTGERCGLRNQRNVHVTGGKGFEIRMDQFQDQMLVAKFGHYILHLLRMLQFGVSLDDHFVASAFDRPVPLISASGTNLGGLDPELYFKLRKNVERSIAFMEALLGDDYEEEATEAVMCLDLNDFRILDHIVKRQPYSQPASASKVLPSSASVTSISSTSSPPTSPTTAVTPRAELAQPLGSSLFDGGSGLYKILGSDNRVRWSCENFYGKHHQTLDKVFSTKLNFLQVGMDTHVRSTEMTGTSENILNTRVIAVSKIKALFRIDLNFDWDFENDKLATVTNMLKQDAASVSTLAIRFSRKVPPLTWRQHLVSYGEDAQPMIAVLNLVKNRKLKHLILEGDVDLFSVPNLGTMDFSNLDIISIMKTNHRGYGHTAALLRNNKTNNGYNNSSAASVRSLDGYDNGERGAAKTYTQENYIPELLSFLQTCSLLTEISLGFPDVVPGHIRILQTCIAGLSRLARVDLFRIVGSSLSGSANSGSSSNSPAAGNKRPILNKKLELSANVSASRVTRLYLSECKVVGDGRARLLESLEEVLMDYGPSLEDLEIKFVGFNDKHAHALEYGTRPQSDQTSCRLRRLVLHGKGLETGGVAALKRVIGRATRSKPQESIVVGNTHGTLGRSTSRRGGPVATGLTVAIAAATPSAGSGLESLSFGTMLDEPTLTHLELCSIDTLADSDWAHLVSELNMKRLITLEVQGVWVGDRTVAMLARCGQNEDIVDEPSSPHSPGEDFSSSLPPAPPAFFSASAPLPLQTLRIHCSSLTNKGVTHFREFLSRLIHLSTISFHGFRKVGSDHWVDMLSRIEFRWVEIIEIVSSGFDDYCGEYLGERIQARSQLPDFVATLSPADAYDTEGSALPAYSAQVPVATSPTATISSSSSNALSSSPPLSAAASPTRRDSLSSRLRASISNTSRPKDPEPKSTPIPSSTSTTSLTRPTASQKYLEVDLRYTDVSAKGLALLRTKVLGQAKRVVVMSRDGEEEEEVDEGEADKEAARLAQKRMAEKESEAKWSAKGGSSSSSSSSPGNGHGASYSGGGGTFSALAYSLSSAPQGPSNRNGGSNGSSSSHGNSSNGTSQSQHQQQGSGQTTRSTFSTVKRFLTKK
ncbi:hypothetical protein EC957_001945 [Mortierella hygrophila]|uniref:Uncharacterized protein n=1 Tax=Mortierella hygrophila TaxID=979708 RepID=A0A9P6F5V4_9FUNG|nr:hypothetical protein EC957_001945 [Mortierella hygrophila]